jgi:hypothetical protein
MYLQINQLTIKNICLSYSKMKKKFHHHTLATTIAKQRELLIIQYVDTLQNNVEIVGLIQAQTIPQM